MTNAQTRTAYTQSGKKVNLRETRETEDGFYGYVLNNQNFAVLVFIPK